MCSVILFTVISQILSENKIQRLDRYKGCMIGLATGDALGVTLEFKDPGSFEPIKDIKGGGPHGLKPGQWTDDTSMSLCLATSLVEKNKFDPIDQLERYVQWYKNGYMSCTGMCFDIGGTTKQALEKFQVTQEPCCGPTEYEKSGNGSIMRLAPVPLFFANDPITATNMSGTSSRTTHGSIQAIDACRYLGSIISGIILNKTKEEILSQEYEPAPNYWKDNPLVNQIDEIKSGSFKRLEPPEIKGSRFVVESLEAALWAFYKSTSFQEGCLLAVNLGCDADTTGAVYGQIAGAYYGINEIPKTWLNKIAHINIIESLAEKICILATHHTSNQP